MAVNNVVYINECGLPLNAVDWLAKHHQSKLPERYQMILDLGLATGSFVVDAGCGPGLWTPLLAQMVGREGRILGIDISREALGIARLVNTNVWCQNVAYECATLDQLPLKPGSVDHIFSANVSQYLPDPVATFAAMGPYLKRGGRLAVKDMDFGTMLFHTIDATLQSRVLQARKYWEAERVRHDYAFEDSWVGSKLAGYLQEAGYTDIEEKAYRIVRQYPLPADFRFYLQGIAEWCVCEGAPYLSPDEVTSWLQCFADGENNVLDQPDFMSEETEFVVSGTWNAPHVYY
jgi:ubiquinone/menaquinone biosynthesis C-methylase UbiE